MEDFSKRSSGLTDKKPSFDFNSAVKDLLAGKKLTGDDGILTPLIKELVETALSAELNSHIAQDVLKGNRNRKNGSTSKTVKTSEDSFELDTPRDRDGSFEPQIVKKYQTSLSSDIEDRILSMYALGMSYTDISRHIEEIYRISVSPATISAITDKVIDKVKEWQSRPLEAVYPFIWLDAIHYKIKENGTYRHKAVYTVLGVDLSGKKDVLGLYLSESEGANFWLSVLTDLKNRGIEDILIASVDGLKGFPEAINSIYPKTEVQLCIVHQIRNSIRYVASKNQKEFMADLKPVYKAVSKDLAEKSLLDLEEKWGKKYPMVIKSWKDKWSNLSNYFKYPPEIRRIIYTTNIIESVHRQFRKLTKTKGAFPNDNSLLKLLYLGVMNASKKWTMPVQNWGLTLSQLSIFFDGRLDNYISV
ncbi:MAG: IS256 family transposase [bacterium]